VGADLDGACSGKDLQPAAAVFVRLSVDHPPAGGGGTLDREQDSGKRLPSETTHCHFEPIESGRHGQLEDPGGCSRVDPCDMTRRNSNANSDAPLPTGQLPADHMGAGGQLRPGDATVALVDVPLDLVALAAQMAHPHAEFGIAVDPAEVDFDDSAVFADIRSRRDPPLRLDRWHAWRPGLTDLFRHGFPLYFGRRLLPAQWGGHLSGSLDAAGGRSQLRRTGLRKAHEQAGGKTRGQEEQVPPCHSRSMLTPAAALPHTCRRNPQPETDFGTLRGASTTHRTLPPVPGGDP
jgi:hypothetical protein